MCSPILDPFPESFETLGVNGAFLRDSREEFFQSNQLDLAII
jgi:hypothetical protein